MKCDMMYIVFVLFIISITMEPTTKATESTPLQPAPSPRLFAVENGYYWRDFRGTIPKDAVIGAPGLLIAQVFCNGILPASFDPTKKEAIAECRGLRTVFKYPIKILCDKNQGKFDWEYVNVDWLLKRDLNEMVLGGYDGNDVYYVGRTFYEAEWRIGRVVPPTARNKGLVIWQNNTRQYFLQDFQILKYSDKTKTKRKLKGINF